MENSSSKITITHPCPFVLKEKYRTDQGFHCQSCQKTVVDYRNKSMSEIAQTANSETCGIFHPDQLSHSPKFTFSKKLAFAVLTVCSFLGFSIHPIQAQTLDTLQRTRTVQAETGLKSEQNTSTHSSQTVEKNKSTKSKKRPYFFRKRKKIKGRFVGTPSF